MAGTKATPVMKQFWEAKEKHNLRFLFTVCGNIHTQNIHRKLGWFLEDSAPAYETFKYL